MASTVTKLTEEEVDDIIYDARAGDLESLQNTFQKIDPTLLVNNLADEYSKSTPIHMAAANGHTEILSYLLSLISKDDANTLVNKQNDSGNTALHWAALNGHIDAVTVLCDFGADPFLKNTAGHDAIFEAENNNKEEVETYFLKKYSIEDLDVGDDGEFSFSVKEGTEIEQVTKAGIEAKKELEAEKELEEKTKDLEI